MTTRDNFADELKAYRDNELPLAQRVAVRLHVAGCRACQEELKQMAQITEELRATEAHDTDVSPGIDPTLRNKIVGNYTPSGASTTPIRANRRVELAVAVSLVVFIAILGISHNQGTTAGNKLNTVASNITDGGDDEEMVAQAPVPAAQPGPVPAAAVHPVNQDMVTVRSGYGSSFPANAPTIVRGGGGATNKVSIVLNGADSDELRRVHREAQISVEVDDPEAKSNDIETMVKTSGGYVASDNLTTGDDGLRTATVDTRVPVDTFDTMLSKIAAEGKVTAKNITGQDITEQVSDANEREGVLEDAASQAQARLSKLGRHANWMDSETARDTREELAEARGRIVLLKKLGELSNITVTLTEKPKPQPPGGMMSDLRDQTKSAYGSLLGALETLLTGLIWVGIYCPIWIPILILGRWAYRRYVGRPASAAG